MKTVNKLTEALSSPEFIQSHRTVESAFTRTRQLPFSVLVCLLLNQLKGALRRECADFFEAVLKQPHANAVSAAAVSKARKNLSPNVFRALNALLIKTVSDSSLVQRHWQNLQVLAVDGSVLNLPHKQALREHFQGGANGTDNVAPQARLSTLFDVHTGLFYHTELLPYALGEGVGAAEHLPHTPSTSVTLYDRGYAAFWLFADHRHHQRDFCARAKRGFNRNIDDFFTSDRPSTVITLSPSAQAKVVCAEQGYSDAPISVRLVRVLLCTGEVEVLITSLLDEARYPSADFERLYAMRWSIEVGYKFSKTRLQIENFSSHRVNGIYQDVYAKLLTQNLAQLLRLAGEQQLEERQASTDGTRKHKQRLSFTDTLHQGKHRLVTMLLRPRGLKRQVAGFVDRLQKFTELVREDRESSPRSPNSTAKRFPLNCKATA